MKKKKKKIAALSLAVLVAGTGAFHAYGSYQQSGESDALLNENILALSSESESEENNIRYHVSHCQYFSPVTGLGTNKCYAYSYMGPNGSCASSHDHGAIACCTGC